MTPERADRTVGIINGALVTFLIGEVVWLVSIGDGFWSVLPAAIYAVAMIMFVFMRKRWIAIGYRRGRSETLHAAHEFKFEHPDMPLEYWLGVETVRDMVYLGMIAPVNEASVGVNLTKHEVHTITDKFRSIGDERN